MNQRPRVALVADVARQRDRLAAAASISATSRLSSPVRRAPTTTCAPSLANSFAVASPMPELAPVMIATLPVNLFMLATYL